MTNPISPDDKESKHISDYLLDEAVQYINQGISTRDWCYHAEEIEWLPILLKPYGRFNKYVMDKVVVLFRETGWKCKWGDYYMGGPTHCFFVHKNHFITKPKVHE